jgi:hypothetical protein
MYKVQAIDLFHTFGAAATAVEKKTIYHWIEYIENENYIRNVSRDNGYFSVVEGILLPLWVNLHCDLIALFDFTIHSKSVFFVLAFFERTGDWEWKLIVLMVCVAIAILRSGIYVKLNIIFQFWMDMYSSGLHHKNGWKFYGKKRAH